MIKFYKATKSKLIETNSATPDDGEFVWVDMMFPTKDEEAEVEKFFSIDVPTREEMHDIEVSSRLYSENGAIFVIATLITPNEANEPEAHSITFIIKDNKLITVRYSELKALNIFHSRVARNQVEVIKNGFDIFLYIMESVIDCLSDDLKIIGEELNQISKSIFKNSTKKSGFKADFQDVLTKIGLYGDFNGKLNESLLSLSQVFIYMATACKEQKKSFLEEITTYTQDIHSLTEYANYLSNRVNILLDATLGMININQNAIIKIFSVASVIFMPPTLVASIYGMNFKHMPELNWLAGYPFAVFLMIFCAVLPYLYFKKKGWL